jgi:hypothetical protein
MRGVSWHSNPVLAYREGRHRGRLRNSEKTGPRAVLTGKIR